MDRSPRDERNALTRKALVRTAARYSRTVMTQVLYIAALHAPRPGDADKDLLEGWPG